MALVYHGIEDETGDPGQQLLPAISRAVFKAHLEHLAATYLVVSPSRLLDAARERRRGDRFPVAITFDDDLPSHLEVAAPVLRAARLPAAFFLSGASLDGANLWWRDLEELYAREGSLRPLRSLPPGGSTGGIHAVAATIERLPPVQRDAVARELHDRIRAPVRILAAEEMKALADDFEIGFHTLRHYLCSTLDDAALDAALSEGRQQLEEVVARPLTMISYPHGKADTRVATAARNAGYELGFTAFATPAGESVDPLLVGRIDAHALSPGEFGRAIAGTLAHDSG